MKVGFFQYAIIWRDREANLEYIGSKLKGTTFDLLVLPELFTSGYAFDSNDELLPFGESLHDSPTVKYLTTFAKQCGGYITGTIPELEDGKLYNTAIFVGAEGLVGSFRKIHLPDYEKRGFSAGDKIEVFNCGEAVLGAMICFDCWFPPLSSHLKQLGAQVICHSSCFGGEVTPTIIPIRALETQSFVVSCNRVGTELFDGEIEAYRGESQIVSPDGRILIKAGNAEELAFIDINLSEVDNPAFGNLICKDFVAEHDKYKIELKR